MHLAVSLNGSLVQSLSHYQRLFYEFLLWQLLNCRDLIWRGENCCHLSFLQRHFQRVKNWRNHLERPFWLQLRTYPITCYNIDWWPSKLCVSCGLSKTNKLLFLPHSDKIKVGQTASNLLKSRPERRWIYRRKHELLVSSACNEQQVALQFSHTFKFRQQKWRYETFF